MHTVIPFFPIPVVQLCKENKGKYYWYMAAARSSSRFSSGSAPHRCATCRHRGPGLGGGHDEREQTLNQILIEMRVRPQHQPNVIVIAATNRPHILSPTSPLTYIYPMWVIAAAMLAPLVLARYGRRPWRRVDVSFVALSFKTSGTLSQDRMSPPPLKLSPGHVVVGPAVTFSAVGGLWLGYTWS